MYELFGGGSLCGSCSVSSKLLFLRLRREEIDTFLTQFKINLENPHLVAVVKEEQRHLLTQLEGEKKKQAVGTTDLHCTNFRCILSLNIERIPFRCILSLVDDQIGWSY